jgi:hypothetical protein
MANPNSPPALIHSIAFCTPHRLAGWSSAPWFDLAINDRHVARITPQVPRPDLAEAGITGAGFDLLFDQSIWFDDVVTLRGPDAITHKVQIDTKSGTRLRDMLRFIDPARQIGLEIGPLDRPLLPKHRFRVYYLDQAPVEQLKARYPGKSQVTHMVVPDFTTGHAPFTEVVGERRFDDAVASHVIEHVPDFVGWLWNIWSVLKEKSVLSMAIPHAERTLTRGAG